MASDYGAIRAENQLRYGTDIGRIGPMLLADRYADRTHFIFELLQNAEDAIARRSDSGGSRSVDFQLGTRELRVGHFGQPFDEADVRGVCGIAESTKDLTAIGRFGIGFKSVYAFTDRPEIHSGSESFAIESFVWPVAVAPLDRTPDETVIEIPLRASDEAGHDEIAVALGRLGASALLFLRQIEEIRWSVVGARSGIYLRESTDMDSAVRRVTVVGQEQQRAEIDETWLVFSRALSAEGEHSPGSVELAFSLVRDKDSGREAVQRVERSPLVVFFPTVLETHLGFLAQGPYRTTPSRDNVPPSDPWNQRLVAATGSLLVEALRWLREKDLLDAAALRCLPIDPAKFDQTNMFAPLFPATKHALSSEPLLPRSDIGHVSARRARLARTKELRDLFSPKQLAALLMEDEELSWLTGDITQDRTPDLRQYLVQQLDIAEMTPDSVVAKLNGPFLEAQSDGWILSLYEFLGGQPALRSRLDDLPLVRVEAGAHVVARLEGHPQAFLPSSVESGFPTVRRAVCETEEARAFLRSLGLTEPDPVDDVVWNVLPKYREKKFEASEAGYEADIRRIMTAFRTDSKAQREKLLKELRETRFVKAIDAGDGRRIVARPSRIYVATDRLKELFAAVPHVLLVNDTVACLRGEDVREMLEACGALRYLRPIEDTSLSWGERSSLRVRAGHSDTSGYKDQVTDWTLSGLKELLDGLPALDTARRREKARLLWEELAFLEERRGKGVFSGEYTWTHYGSYRVLFDAAFVRQLNLTPWVPDADGELQRPELVVFDTLGWKPNGFLSSAIRFKPPVIDQLAREAGIEPGLLDLLKKLGVTSEAELRDRLGLDDEPTTDGGGSGDDVEDAVKKLLGGVPAPTPPVPDPGGAESSGSTGGQGGSGDGNGTNRGTERHFGPGQGPGGSSGRGPHNRTPGGAGGRPFISYLAVQSDEDDHDPDGLDQEARMALEAKAIDLILAREPTWQRTPTHNPGYDLVDPGDDAAPKRWCEVKAMTGSLADRAVGVSHAQFACAQDHGSAYWLYVVEHAGATDARIVRIQDPAGKARTFTFDRGWLHIADVDVEQDHRED
jgi:hypothetical protein